ncbi:MAG: hypothetical protein Fur0010_19870 [Bdellovibrio sp.]
MPAIDLINPQDPRATNSARSQFKSKWEYIKSFSRWHFDKWKVEDPAPFKVFMNIEGDWKAELEKLQYEINVGLDNYVFKGAKGDGLIEKDFRDWGYKEDMCQYQRTYNVPEIFVKMAEQLHLYKPDIRIHRQMPGMVAPIHADAYCSHPDIDCDPSKHVGEMRRFIIQLTDWDWGHFWNFGNTPWVQWKAGDVVYFESRDVVHCTANAGKEPRVTMIVTGWMTEKTFELVNGPKVTVKI